MTADVLPFREVDNSLADALAERGVEFPLRGFAPGLYMQTCMMCGKRHMAAKSASVCLPCAVAVTVLVASRKEDDKDATYAAGRQSGLDDVRRFLAGGARSGSLVRTPTPAQREDVKRQAREAEAERGEAPPRRYPDTEYLKETSRRAQERIEAERRAAGPDDEREDAVADVPTFAVVRTDAPGIWADNAPKAMLDGVEHYVLGPVEQRAGHPEGAAEINALVARTQAARERIEAERRASDRRDTDPGGGDAA